MWQGRHFNTSSKEPDPTYSCPTENPTEFIEILSEVNDLRVKFSGCIYLVKGRWYDMEKFYVVYWDSKQEDTFW